MDIERVGAAMASLEADGIIERTGEFKRDPDGKLRPLYRLTEKGRALDKLPEPPIPH